MRTAGPRVASRSLRQRSQGSRSVEYSVERQCPARSRVFAMAADAGGDPKLPRQRWRPFCGPARCRRSRPGHHEYTECAADAATSHPTRIHGGRSAGGEILHPPQQRHDRHGPDHDVGCAGTRRHDENRQCNGNTGRKFKRNGRSKRDPDHHGRSGRHGRASRHHRRRARHSTLLPEQRRRSSLTQRPMPQRRMPRQKPHRTTAIRTTAAVRPTPALPLRLRRPMPRYSPLQRPLSPIRSSLRRLRPLLRRPRTR